MPKALPKEKMTQIDLLNRRRILARLVSTGQGVLAVAERFNVTDATVRNACREFGVDIRFRRRGKSMGIYA